MDAEATTLLNEVEWLLQYSTDGTECYCDDPECSEQTPKCKDMHAVAALRKLREALDPPHRSLQPERLVNDPERIYAERWERENLRQPGINKGFTLLEWICCPSGRALPDRVSHRDAEVAASVVQWFGTSCGGAFVHECERLIDRARAERRGWSSVVMHNVEPPARDLATAELLAGCVKGKACHDQLVRSIAAALGKARREAVKSALEAAM